jgi:outer membrane protein, multidrug efflux system
LFEVLVPPSLSRLSLPRLVSAGATVVLLAGCSSLGLDYAKPELTLSSNYVGTSPAGSTLSSETAWWTAFGDKQLNAFVAAGLAQNLSVLQAIERVAAARATARINGVSFQPSVNGTATVAMSGDSASDVTTTSRSAAIDASWELDLFGAGKRSREAQVANVQAAQEAVNGARLTLIGDIASAYVNIRTYQRRLALARASLETQTATAGVVRKQVEAGAATELALSQSVGQQESTAAGIPSLEAALQQSINALAVLLGQEPSEIQASFKKSGSIPRAAGSIGKGVPADLLRSRPDIRQAERELASAVADIGVKEADLYPSLTLSGALSVTANVNAWNLAPSLTLPIFNRDRLTANVDLAKSTARGQYLAYRETVLGAVRDVEDALVAYGREKSRRASLAASVAAYTKASQLSKQLYESGSATYSELLSAQAAQQSAEDALAQSDAQLALDYIGLAKALGGGWQLAG